MGFQSVPAMERYLSHIDKSGGPDGCWPWTAHRKQDGLPYGQFSDEHRRHAIAHRWGYEHLVGPIPEGHEIRHTCDNPPCQNPAHWLTGTRQDNVDDCRARDRIPKGSRANRSVLTEGDVREIRRLLAAGMYQIDIAPLFGVSNNSISCIASGKSWGWLQ